MSDQPLDLILADPDLDLVVLVQVVLGVAVDGEQAVGARLLGHLDAQRAGGQDHGPRAEREGADGRDQDAAHGRVHDRAVRAQRLRRRAVAGRHDQSVRPHRADVQSVHLHVQHDHAPVVPRDHYFVDLVVLYHCFRHFRRGISRWI